LQSAADSISKPPWKDRQAFSQAVYEELYRLNLYGRAEVYLADRGEHTFADESDWIDLPFNEAIETFKSRFPIYSKSFHRTLSDALKAKSWTIAGDHNAYSREMAKESLEVAIEAGWSKQRWINFAKDTGIPNLGEGHLNTVFDTNILSSYQHGRWKQQHTPNMVRKRPFMVYRTVGDPRVRESHRALNGFAAQRDHPAWQSIYPPNGFNCRCRVEILRQSGVDGLKKNGTIKELTPNDKPTPVDPGTGKPAVPDDGWSTNPGEWLKEPSKSQRKPAKK